MPLSPHFHEHRLALLPADLRFQSDLEWGSSAKFARQVSGLQLTTPLIVKFQRLEALVLDLSFMVIIVGQFREARLVKVDWMSLLPIVETPYWYAITILSRFSLII